MPETCNHMRHIISFISAMLELSRALELFSLEKTGKETEQGILANL